MNIRAISFLCLILLLSACREEFDLGPTTLDEQLVVSGRLTNEYRKHQIQLSLSGDFGSKQYQPASGAKVQITDGLDVFELNESQAGIYRTDSMAAVPGRSYTLQIEWAGKSYVATDQMGDVPDDFEPVRFEPTVRGFQEFEYRRHQFGFQEANAWELSVVRLDTTGLPPVSNNQLGQQIGVQVDAKGTYKFEFFTHPEIIVNGLMKFEESHFYGYIERRQVIQKRISLSEAYYRYLRALFLETEWRGTLFDARPANIQGNVSGGGLGFFSAHAVRKKTFVIGQ